MTSPAWTRDRIDQLLANNPAAVYRAVLAIYDRQTADEKSAGLTLKNNGVGFCGSDSHALTKVAKRLQAGQTIPPQEFQLIQKRIMRYGRQLLEIALAKQIEQQLTEMTERKS